MLEKYSHTIKYHKFHIYDELFIKNSSIILVVSALVSVVFHIEKI